MDKEIITKENNNIDFFDMKSGFFMGNNIVGLNKDCQEGTPKNFKAVLEKVWRVVL